MNDLARLVAGTADSFLTARRADLERLEATAEIMRRTTEDIQRAEAKARQRWIEEMGECPRCDEDGTIPENISGSGSRVVCCDCEGSRQRQPFMGYAE